MRPLSAFSLKCFLVCLAAAFFVIAGDAHGQQTTCDMHTPSTPPTDRDALIALYCATDGANWAQKGSWLSAMALGNWDGVTATNNGTADNNDDDTVTGLSLTFNDLTGTIPTELGALTSLQWLTLDKNQLTGTIPTELGSLTSLN